jgi:hypothetical protein
MLIAAFIWLAGFVTVVPYTTYYLVVHASRDQYAWLITLVLFWTFGYWGVVTPALAAWKVRVVFRKLERAKRDGQLLAALEDGVTEAVAVDFIASDNHIPRFLAARVYRLLVRGVREKAE